MIICRTPKANRSPMKSRLGRSIMKSSNRESVSITDQNQSLEGRINIELVDLEKPRKTIKRNEGPIDTVSNASNLTEGEDLVLYENNNICMQSEKIKQAGMTNYIKGNLDMNNESIESFDDSHAASVNEKFEKTVKKRVLTNIESHDTLPR